MTYSPNNFGKPVAAAMTQSTTAANNTGGTLNQFTPVKCSPTGMANISLSVPADVEAIIGLTSTAIANGTNGVVVSNGFIYNCNSLGFAVGDGVWIDYTGNTLTNTPPDLTDVNFAVGMVVVKVGTVVANLQTPSQQDLFVLIENRGEL